MYDDDDHSKVDFGLSTPQNSPVVAAAAAVG
jgi:hypothetical protein